MGQIVIVSLRREANTTSYESSSSLHRCRKAEGTRGSGVGVDIEAARLVKEPSQSVSSTRFVCELDRARLAREPQQKTICIYTDII